MAEPGDGFLSRWSRRKQALREGKPLEPEERTEPVAAPLPVPAAVTPPPSAEHGVGEPQPAAPTLADVQSLTPGSDFSRFVAPEVAPEVRNAAMKKLFADPHFNVMDGLDVYIDDYSKPDPIPPAMLRQLASAKFLKLFGDEETDAAGDAPAAGAPGPEALAAAQQTPPVPAPAAPAASAAAAPEDPPPGPAAARPGTAP
jgi:hypothetical protein